MLIYERLSIDKHFVNGVMEIIAFSQNDGIYKGYVTEPTMTGAIGRPTLSLFKKIGMPSLGSERHREEMIQVISRLNTHGIHKICPTGAACAKGHDGKRTSHSYKLAKKRCSKCRQLKFSSLI